MSISGTSITVTGASGSLLDGDGSRWWDGEGSNGGKTKPKSASRQWQLKVRLLTAIGSSKLAL